MRNIGFSHRVLYRVIDTDSLRAIDIYRKNSTGLIEVCLNKTTEIKKIKKIENQLKEFRCKSIHLPSDFVYENNLKTKKLLDKIFSLYKYINADLALIHPDKVKDFSLFNKYKINWAIENLDIKAKAYNNFEDINNFFIKNKNWKLVLDLNHCYTNDKTMKSADELIKSFKNKIGRIHLSGFKKSHEPLFQLKQKIILDYCKKLKVPVVIESTFNSVIDLEKEYRYIIKQLI